MGDMSIIVVERKRILSPFDGLPFRIDVSATTLPPSEVCLFNVEALKSENQILRHRSEIQLQVTVNNTSSMTSQIDYDYVVFILHLVAN